MFETRQPQTTGDKSTPGVVGRQIKWGIKRENARPQSRRAWAWGTSLHNEIFWGYKLKWLRLIFAAETLRLLNRPFWGWHKEDKRLNCPLLTNISAILFGACSFSSIWTAKINRVQDVSGITALITLITTELKHRETHTRKNRPNNNIERQRRQLCRASFEGQTVAYNHRLPVIHSEARKKYWKIKAAPHPRWPAHFNYALLICSGTYRCLRGNMKTGGKKVVSVGKWIMEVNLSPLWKEGRWNHHQTRRGWSEAKGPLLHDRRVCRGHVRGSGYLMKTRRRYRRYPGGWRGIDIEQRGWWRSRRPEASGSLGAFIRSTQHQGWSESSSMSQMYFLRVAAAQHLHRGSA